MKLHQRAAVIAAIAAAGAWSAATGAAAEDPAPPSWKTLLHCAEMTDPTQELACYRAAMREAGFKPNTEAVAAQKRRAFGLPKPSLPFIKHADKPAAQTAQAGSGASAKAADAAAPAPAPAAEAEDDENKVMVQLAEVALIPPDNRLLVVTTEGAVWKQTDTQTVAPRPRPGESMQIRQTGFGGFFCKFGKYNAVRCIRAH